MGAVHHFHSGGCHRIRESERPLGERAVGVDFRSAVGRIEADSAPFGANAYTEDRRIGAPTGPAGALSSGRRLAEPLTRFLP